MERARAGHDSQTNDILGHVIRTDELEKVVLTGYVEGRRDRGNLLTYLRKRKDINLVR